MPSTRSSAACVVRSCLVALATMVLPGAADAATGAKLRDCAECPELVEIPAGTFMMGSDEPHAIEAPAHVVTISRPFAIGVYEVTFDEWHACVEAKGCATDPDDHQWGRGRRPVINVTFEDVSQYLIWISRHTGRIYRLPTEAEWEYAARAGTGTAFWWGDEVGQNKANCRDCGSEWSAKGSAPVGSFPPNAFGLHDTAGNVWEWVADCWNENHVGTSGDGSPRLNGECRYRVMRGGSWYYFSKNSRSTWRFRNDARVKSYGIGFRVVRELE